MRAVTCVELAFGLALGAAPAHAATLHVCPDGSGEYPSIQAAADAASSGDTIELCAGTFTGPGNLDVDFGSRSLTLMSPYGYESTIVDLAYLPEGAEEAEAHFGLQVGAGSATRVEGITFQYPRRVGAIGFGDGGAFRCVSGSLVLERVRILGWSPFSAWNGGGVYLESGTLVANDCVFIGIGARGGGGAIYTTGSWIALNRCEFVGNFGCSRGALRLDGGGTITDCTFQGSAGNCSENAAGLAIQAYGGDISLIRCTFIGHRDFDTAVISGGVALIEDCLFEDNESAYGPSVSAGDATIRRSVFRRNLAWISSSSILAGRDVTIEDCLFEDNWGYDTPAAGVGCLSLSGASTVQRCTIVGAERRPAIQVGSAASVQLDQVIVAGGTGTYAAVTCEDGGSVAVACSDIFGNVGGDWVGCVAGMDGTAGNISADPLFCAPEAGDYTLRPGSPCAPANSACGQIGAYGVGCGTTALRPSTWGEIKGAYR